MSATTSDERRGVSRGHSSRTAYRPAKGRIQQPRSSLSQLDGREAAARQRRPEGSVRSGPAMPSDLAMCERSSRNQCNRFIGRAAGSLHALQRASLHHRRRSTPRHAVDQLFDLSSDSAALGILRNLRDKTVANPLAVGIVGLGMAWLMYSRGREARHPKEAPNLGIAETFSGDAPKCAGEREVSLPPGL